MTHEFEPGFLSAWLVEFSGVYVAESDALSLSVEEDDESVAIYDLEHSRHARPPRPAKLPDNLELGGDVLRPFRAIPADGLPGRFACREPRGRKGGLAGGRGDAE
ncbi:MAG: hypothetical protein JRG73_20900 [Deltaproteobacteria bacterium]|nr:hypothetical protein [Deltaproteobacteria bacterium]